MDQFQVLNVRNSCEVFSVQQIIMFKKEQNVNSTLANYASKFLKLFCNLLLCKWVEQIIFYNLKKVCCRVSSQPSLGFVSSQCLIFNIDTEEIIICSVSLTHCSSDLFWWEVKNHHFSTENCSNFLVFDVQCWGAAVVVDWCQSVVEG